MEVLPPRTSSIIGCFCFMASFGPLASSLPLSLSLSLVQEIMQLLVTGANTIRKSGPENRTCGTAGHCHLEIKFAFVFLLPTSESVLLLNSRQSCLTCFLCSQLSAVPDHVVKSKILPECPSIYPLVHCFFHSTYLSSFSTW